MDILSDILGTLNMKGVFYFQTAFSGEWGVTVPDYRQAARFHLVVQGHLYVSFSDGEVLKLNPGDLILIPHGRTHILSDAPRDSAPPLETVLSDAGYAGDGFLAVGAGAEHEKTKLICGHFSFRAGADHPLLRALPDYFIVSPSQRVANSLLDDVMRILLQQVFLAEDGTIASVIRLSEIMFIELLRVNLVNNAVFDKIMNAFTDQKISQAISLIHKDPNAAWSVDSLASEVGMSRSRFAHRFKDLLGMGPMTYLSEWRLQKSLQLLEKSNVNIQDVAYGTGYKSAAAFTRAFSGRFGVSPSQYRQDNAQ